MNKGFTLLELLIVIAIIGLLASAVLVTYPSVTGKARLANTLQWAGSMSHLLGANAVGIWTFDNISGTTVYDDSGLGNNGTIVGATQVDDGVIGKAMSFDGGDYVTIPDNPSLDGMVVLTISAWAKGNTTISDTIVSKHNGESGSLLSYFLWYDDVSGNLEFITKTSSIVTLDTGYAGDTNWHHYGAVYDGTIMKVYIDGVQVGSTANQTGTINNNAQDVKIGAYSRTSTPSGGNWSGLIDDVRIFREAFTQAQVQQLYAEGLPTHQPLAQQ